MAKNVDIIFQFQDRARMCPARTLEHPRSLFCRSDARAPLWQTTLADLRTLLHSTTMWPTTAGHMINKQRSAATETAKDANDLRFRPTLSTTDPDRRERFHASENPIQTNNQPINQPTEHV